MFRRSYTAKRWDMAGRKRFSSSHYHHIIINHFDNEPIKMIGCQSVLITL